MKVTGGTNLSLYEVQKAARIVTSTGSHDSNMIFGSVLTKI